MLCSVSSKFSVQIFPRSGISVIGKQWCSYGGVGAIGSSNGSIDTGKRLSHHRLPNADCGKDGISFIKSGLFCRNFSNHHGHVKLTSSIYQKHLAPPSLLTQVQWYTSTTTQTQSPEEASQAKSDPSPHFKTRKNLEAKSDKLPDNVQAAVERPGSHQYLLPHPIWSEEELDAVEVTHKPPKEKVDKAAYWACKALRANFDFFSGFTWGKRTERKWIYRIIFLETVAGVPGMVAAMSRHLRSLRRMQRDHGWIHTLLEEAENERMHLMTALEIKQPSLFFRLMVLGAQGIFVNLFFISYLISPRFCHRFVGYLEEEAVITYTKLLKDLKEDALPKWKDKKAPEISINYWKLRPDADYIDLFRAIRADEAHHREVNHTLSDIKPNDPNPYGPGK